MSVTSLGDIRPPVIHVMNSIIAGFNGEACSVFLGSPGDDASLRHTSCNVFRSLAASPHACSHVVKVNSVLKFQSCISYSLLKMVLLFPPLLSERTQAETQCESFSKRKLAPASPLEGREGWQPHRSSGALMIREEGMGASSTARADPQVWTWESVSAHSPWHWAWTSYFKQLVVVVPVLVLVATWM